MILAPGYRVTQDPIRHRESPASRPASGQNVMLNTFADVGDLTPKSPYYCAKLRSEPYYNAGILASPNAVPLGSVSSPSFSKGLVTNVQREYDYCIDMGITLLTQVDICMMHDE